MSKDIFRYQQTLPSWGGLPSAISEIYSIKGSLSDLFSRIKADKLLVYGAGRSYGDCCLNDGGALLLAKGLDNILAFDADSGLIRVEAGITFGELLKFSVPRGFFVPVSPGTQYVTIGGAVANNIHGKNHHRAGNFGDHVTRIGLFRSDFGYVEISRQKHPELFSATIGGIGLTGVILWVEFALKRVVSPWIQAETRIFRSLDHFFEISESSNGFEYTVAWLDCLSSGRNFGRGVFISGNHGANADRRRSEIFKMPKPYMPFYAPAWTLNKLSVNLFNFFYYNSHRIKPLRGLQHYENFFYPLDKVVNWNKIYGRRGFFQFQAVFESGTNGDYLKKFLRKIADSGYASFLAVLKEFGEVSDLGMLSFPKKGVTLALDFPNNGERTVDFLKELDQMVSDFGGRVYPAKDSIMSSKNFAKYYPKLPDFCKLKDPRFSSSFFRRVVG
ncbi:MAG TPA: FAD-binding oxidoreductase [Oligoflexia bacterium]|nr:FAD-binding oxidoreductase [Oligoflexia bacterium]HMP27016.1 FAD-binding oxidoreductase [Oligoflexia bacterium]